MLVKLEEIISDPAGHYSFREIFLKGDKIILLTDDVLTARKINVALDKNVDVCRVVVDVVGSEREIAVVGSARTIKSKLNAQDRRQLNG